MGQVIPDPPGHLASWPGAGECWHRIIVRLMQRGLWPPIYEPMAALTAVECGMYRRMCRYPMLAEETRQHARAALVQMCYLAPERAALAAIDQAGRDIELLAVTAPLGSA